MDWSFIFDLEIPWRQVLERAVLTGYYYQKTGNIFKSRRKLNNNFFTMPKAADLPLFSL